MATTKKYTLAAMFESIFLHKATRADRHTGSPAHSKT